MGSGNEDNAQVLQTCKFEVLILVTQFVVVSISCIYSCSHFAKDKSAYMSLSALNYISWWFDTAQKFATSGTATQAMSQDFVQ